MKRFSIILFSAFCILHSDFSQTVLTAEGLAAFGKKPSSGGGGGGGGTWTLVTSSSTQGTTGNTTTGALNTSGANLITVGFVWAGGTTPTLSDSKGNIWTLGVTSTTGGGNPKVNWYYCISPTVGSGHTFTVTAASGFSSHVHVYALTKSGGTPAFHTSNTGTATGNFGSSHPSTGSITPANANSLFFSSVWWDTANANSPTANSSFTVPNASTSGGGGGIQTAYKIKSSDSSAENVTWTPSPSINADANSNLIDFN